MSVSTTEKIGLLRTLLEDHSKSAAALSDRQLAVAVSVVTFQLALVAGLSMRPITMTPWFAAIAVFILGIFEFVACHYIASKARLYWLHQDRRKEVETLLLQLAELRGSTEMSGELSQPVDADRPGSTLESIVRGGRAPSTSSSARFCRVCLRSTRSVMSPPNKALNRTVNSSVQLTLGAVWRHTPVAGSGPVSAVASRLTPIR